MFPLVVPGANICAALSLLLLSNAADGETALQIELEQTIDPGWELTGVELQLDGTAIATPQASDTAGARSLWSGVVAPGPHTLVALLFFRSRAPIDPTGKLPEPVRLVTEHQLDQRPIRPLVLLITPARPAPPGLSDPPQAHFALAPH
jgi:hypothetical protein